MTEKISLNKLIHRTSTLALSGTDKMYLCWTFQESIKCPEWTHDTEDLQHSLCFCEQLDMKAVWQKANALLF